MRKHALTAGRLFCTLLIGASLVSTAMAVMSPIEWGGDVLPAEPATWTSSTVAFVGNTGSGTVVVSAGGDILSSRAFIAFSSNSTGHVTVQGSGSTWTNANDMVVGNGNGGYATMRILDGGTVVSDSASIGAWSNSTGSVIVDGANSTWTNTGNLYVDNGGGGTLEIRNGGTVSNAGCFVGMASEANGLVAIDGPDSTWTSDNCMYIGDWGRGTVQVTGGARVTSTQATHLGYSAGATGRITVDGKGSTWDEHYFVNVGYRGAGELEITNGGQVSDLAGSIGLESGSLGRVTVTGIGSRWTNSVGLVVGESGSGVLDIALGGLVSTEKLLIALNPGSSGVINMSTGGMLALSGEADDSLAQFLALINGPDAICYWDSSTGGWAPLTSATPGADYTLAYIADADSDLCGYTVLTVGVVPEPAMLGLLFVGALAVLARRYR